MKKKALMILVIAGFMASFFAAPVSADGKSELAVVRAATAEYHNVEKAKAAGWNLVPGMDECAALPGVGGMGYHFLNLELMDLELNVHEPEALVFAPAPNGGYRLVAVEYIVPAEPWDMFNDVPPAILGHNLHYNPFLGIYALHVWLWEHNPAGMFEDWNPRVSCG